MYKLVMREDWKTRHGLTETLERPKKTKTEIKQSIKTVARITEFTCDLISTFTPESSKTHKASKLLMEISRIFNN